MCGWRPVINVEDADRDHDREGDEDHGEKEILSQ